MINVTNVFDFIKNILDMKSYRDLIRMIRYNDMENPIALTCMHPLLYDNYKLFRELIRV